MARRPVVVAALGVAFALCAAAGPGVIPAPVSTVAAEVRNRPLPERIEQISATFLGVPYGKDPLGEGQPPDLDPLARYDAFDCQTYVEEVLALALAADPADAGRVRASLRYGEGPVDYAHRRHFMELQWLPGNVDGGWLIPTTDRYGEVTHLREEITDATWAAWPDRKKFAMETAQLPHGEMKLDVLPIATAIRAAPRIRPGSVVLIVRKPKPGVPIWTTHLGFVVSGGTFRHASLTHHEVRDQSLAEYLTQASTWSGWPAIGIAVLEPVEQGPRLISRCLPAP